MTIEQGIAAQVGQVRIVNTLQSIDATAWDQLLAMQDQPTPFMRHAYLNALQTSHSAVADSGWQAQFVTLWQGADLVGACPLYLKNHSYGEYVFDWAWADAYHKHGLAYYPKAVIAVPFTPVMGTRLLATNPQTRQALLQAAINYCSDAAISSLHLLFASPADLQASQALQLLQRQTVQFHWKNQAYENFDAFLASLSQDKRKKIRQERRKVHDAGVHFEIRVGDQIRSADWEFFYRCYAQTYWEHGNAPYLTPAFFQSMQAQLSAHWVLFTAYRQDQPIASSLLAVQGLGTAQATAYGRYWGALERVDCLHFEACFYQPLQWCIAQKIQVFEGGAQGEHKMSRALMPTPTYSAHWLAHPQFSEAVAHFLTQENAHLDAYVTQLAQHSPFKAFNL